MSSSQSAQNESSSTAPSTFSSFFGGLPSQTVLIAAVLYYFGWLETQSYFGYFSIDTSLLAFNTTDYILRSVDIAFPALVVAAIVSIAALGVNHTILTYLSGTHANSSLVRYMRILPLTLRLSGAALAGLALAGIMLSSDSRALSTILLPLLLLTGAALFLYSLQAADVLKSPSSGSRRLQYQVTLILVLVATLWTLSLYATWVGRNNASNLVGRIETLPSVILYTSQRVAISGGGVSVAQIEQAGSKYQFQYTGLRLLTRSGDRLFLIPVDWRKGHDSAFIIRESDDVRADVRAR